MKSVMVIAVAALLCGCAREGSSPTQQASATDSVATTSVAPATTTEDNAQAGTWSGQIKTGPSESVLNYVGAESGDWVPMRFQNDSEAGKKLLAVCGNDDLCEFTGAVEFLDEAPPPDASAVGRIVRVDRVKKQ